MAKLKIAVLKIGSKSVADEQGKIRKEILIHIAKDVQLIQSEGWKVIIVSSGAVVCGKNDYGLLNKTATDQVRSMVGQRHLLNHWAEAFGRVNMTIGQGLYTNRMLESLRERKQIIKEGLMACFETGVVPILNENDAAVLDELKELRNEGDNDHFASLVASLIKASMLVFLTTVDGVIDPQNDALITSLDARDKEFHKRLEAWPGQSNGGMASKVFWGQQFVCATDGQAVIKKYSEPLPLSRAIRGIHDGTIIELI